MGSTQLGKRERFDETPSVKKSKRDSSSFKVGDHVVDRLEKYHIPCRVVQVVNKGCKLYCCKGVLNMCYSISDLKALSSNWSISLENWRTATQVSVIEVIGDPANLEVCECCVSKPARNDIDLTEDSWNSSSGAGSPADRYWLRNALYTLTSTNKKVLSRSGWLLDSVISAAQLLILQHMSGLQHTVLQEEMSFQVHRDEFVQIINIRNSHWCTFPSIGCGEGVVNVYDSLYPSVSKSTLKLIASLVFRRASKLVVRMMDVGKQCIRSDCSFLAIAFVYDICSCNDPCRVKFDNRSIRQHLASCLENVAFHASQYQVSKGL